MGGTVNPKALAQLACCGAINKLYLHLYELLVFGGGEW
jgi:hypothetical protein